MLSLRGSLAIAPQVFASILECSVVKTMLPNPNVIVCMQKTIDPVLLHSHDASTQRYGFWSAYCRSCSKLPGLCVQTAALRNLGLNIRRAKVARKGDQITNKFYITEQKSSEKIVKSARLQVHRSGTLLGAVPQRCTCACAVAWRHVSLVA